MTGHPYSHHLSARHCIVRRTYILIVLRSMQEVHLDKHVKLVDSPGIVMDSGNSDSAVILRNCVKVSPALSSIIPRVDIPPQKKTSGFIIIIRVVRSLEISQK